MTEQSRQQEVIEALKVVIDPDLGRDIVSLGFIKQLSIDGGRVSFVLELTTPACPIKERFREECQTALGKLPWVDEVHVEMSARKHRRPAASENDDGLKGVRRIIAVSSCKGGVGKSTVAVNLAYALAQSGAAVGLLDADIYGPSLPTLIRLEDTALHAVDGKIRPNAFEGVKLMSFGYAADAGQAAIMRGPMVSSVISQLALSADWGELDYLVVDLPPGTGDIQLTLTQKIAFTGAVIVTTPQKLSFVDVVKGIQMFETVKVPTLAVVENMSYFVCDSCGERHYPFGQGAMRRLTEQFGMKITCEIPMEKSVSDSCDKGRPVMLDAPESELAGRYQRLAGDVVREIEKIENGAIAIPDVSYVEGKGIVIRTGGGDERIVDPADLRRRCGCAGCKDEFTGEAILKPSDVPDDVHPVSIEKMGNYAVAVRWSDGHDTSIYPFEKL